MLTASFEVKNIVELLKESIPGMNHERAVHIDLWAVS